MPRSPLLYTQPPESGEGLEFSLQTLAEGFQVILAELGIIWVLLGVGQRHEDDPSFEGPEGDSVNARQTSEKVPAACPRETPYPVADASTPTSRRTELVIDSGVLEGESRYGPSY